MKGGKRPGLSKPRVWPLIVSLFFIFGFISHANCIGASRPYSLSALGESTQWSTVTVDAGRVSIQSLKRPSKGNPKLGSSLNRLLETYRSEGLTGAQAFSAAHNMSLEDGRVQVTIVTAEEAIGDVRDAVEASGGEYQLHYKNLLQALVPIGVLDTLGGRVDVGIIREPRRAVPQPVVPPTPMAGTQTSQGLAASNALEWHAVGYDGAGVRVAIIDVGFDGYAGLLGTDLPSSVTTYDWTGTGLGGSVHGTGCAEVVYDLAPGITMYLHKATTDVEIGNAVDQAITDGVDVISMSLGWPMGGPGDGTGIGGDLVNEARMNGIFPAIAAGNNAEECWNGTYNDDGSDTHLWAPGQNVNFFGPGDGSAYNIPAGSLIWLSLHWDDWTAVNQDYDLYLVYWNGAAWQVLGASVDVQNGGPGQTPEEEIFTVAPFTAPYGALVYRWDATRDVCLRLFAQKTAHLDEWVPSRSLTFPADSPDAISVGAVDVNSPYPLEDYSSRGPTFGAGGACSGGSIKPDITAYANVSTVSYGPGGFNGTSAATPHVAGAVALVKGAYPSYTVTQLQNYLEVNAVDLGDPGKDNLYGSGRLHLGNPPTAHLVVGLGETSGGWSEVFSDDYSHADWLQVEWQGYNSANGEGRIATGDIDGDGRDEVVIGLGSGSGGYFEVKKDDYSHLAWGRIQWAGYNSANGGSWPACGDVDGDGADEIIIGLGSGGSGYFEVFDYDAGNVTHKDWVRVNWTGYNTANGETRPACGELDGDGNDEIVAGLGSGSGGYMEVFDDAVAGYAHLAWPRVEWKGYNIANGETRPACGDIDGDGNDEIVAGLGSGSGGFMEVFDDAVAGYAHLGWPQVEWKGYHSSNGETWPAVREWQILPQ